jgi:uncharacterized membrane protein
LKFASSFDGDQVVLDIADDDVCFYLHRWSNFFLYFCIFLFIILAFSVYFMQPRVDDWKAEYLYSTVFHVNNKVPLHDLPVEIQCLSPHSVLSTQGEELIMMLSQMS